MSGLCSTIKLGFMLGLSWENYLTGVLHNIVLKACLHYMHDFVTELNAHSVQSTYGCGSEVDQNWIGRCGLYRNFVNKFYGLDSAKGTKILAKIWGNRRFKTHLTGWQARIRLFSPKKSTPSYSLSTLTMMLDALAACRTLVRSLLVIFPSCSIKQLYKKVCYELFSLCSYSVSMFLVRTHSKWFDAL